MTYTYTLTPEWMELKEAGEAKENNFLVSVSGGRAAIAFQTPDEAYHIVNVGEYFHRYKIGGKVYVKSLLGIRAKLTVSSAIDIGSDKSKLLGEIQVSTPLYEEGQPEYIPDEFWEAFEDALNAANLVLNDDEATQVEIDSAFQDLYAARNALPEYVEPEEDIGFSLLSEDGGILISEDGRRIISEAA